MSQSIGWGPDVEREEALWRAAQLEAIELNSRKSAIELLKAFQKSWPESEHRADAFALLAELYEPDRSARMKEKNLRKALRKAAQTWELAAETDSDHERAGNWLVRAAGIWQELDRPARADSTWRKASAYPEHRLAALMAIANSQLAESPELAYDAFRRALKQNPDLADASLARLGMATALERMERYMDAEETIDLALSEDLGDPALTQRKRRLEAIR
jgi:tetratricopeptide (TPR) repeat protein